MERKDVPGGEMARAETVRGAGGGQRRSTVYVSLLGATNWAGNKIPLCGRKRGLDHSGAL